MEIKDRNRVKSRMYGFLDSADSSDAGVLEDQFGIVRVTKDQFNSVRDILYKNTSASPPQPISFPPLESNRSISSFLSSGFPFIITPFSMYLPRITLFPLAGLFHLNDSIIDSSSQFSMLIFGILTFINVTI